MFVEAKTDVTHNGELTSGKSDKRKKGGKVKTHKNMAEEEADRIERQAILCVSLLAMNDGEYFAAKKAYKAGYQAAKNQLQLQPFHMGADVYIIDANNPRPKPMPLSVAEQYQFADADKVTNSSNNSNGWISVKERLPNVEKTSRALRRESTCVLIVSYGNVFVAHLCEDWSERNNFIFEACNCNCRAFDMEIDEWKLDQVTHWMPLPEPPKEEK